MLPHPHLQQYRLVKGRRLGMLAYGAWKRRSAGGRPGVEFETHSDGYYCCSESSRGGPAMRRRLVVADDIVDAAAVACAEGVASGVGVCASAAVALGRGWAYAVARA